MLNWKILSLQAALAVIFAFVSVNIFTSNAVTSERIEAIEQRLSGEIGELKKQLERAETQSQWKLALNNLNRMDSVLNDIKSRVEKLEQNSGAKDARNALQQSGNWPNSNVPPDIPLPQAMPKLPLPGSDGTNPSADWRSQLSTEQKTAVDGLFKEHTTRLTELLPKPSGGEMPHPDELKGTIDAEIQRFREEMKSVLTPDQYQSFLSTMPNPAAMNPQGFSVPSAPQ